VHGNQIHQFVQCLVKIVEGEVTKMINGMPNRNSLALRAFGMPRGRAFKTIPPKILQGFFKVDLFYS